MKLLEVLTDKHRQEIKYTLENGDKAIFRFYYMPAVQGWYIDVEYKDFKCYGTRMYASDNILNAFKNILPFGIMVIVVNGSESELFADTDFIENRVLVFVLMQSEYADL